MTTTDRLSPHFAVWEAEKSQVAARLGIENRIPDALRPAVEAVAVHILEPLRARYGVPLMPSSWYRCPALNHAIGGAKRSQHTTGEAVDVEVPGVANVEAAHWLADALDFDQLILEHWRPGEPGAGWLHISYRGLGNRRSVLTYDGHGYTRGLPAV